MANPAYSTRYRLPDGRYAVDVTENKTLAAEDSGLVQNVTVASVVVTLPATATQGSWTIRDGGVKATNAATGAKASAAIPTVDPNGSDTLAGLNVEGTEQDGKYVRNTGGRIGDEISIMNTGATNGGIITRAVGDWILEA
jgi:hypothetical protein